MYAGYACIGDDVTGVVTCAVVCIRYGVDVGGYICCGVVVVVSIVCVTSTVVV